MPSWFAPADVCGFDHADEFQRPQCIARSLATQALSWARTDSMNANRLGALAGYRRRCALAGLAHLAWAGSAAPRSPARGRLLQRRLRLDLSSIRQALAAGTLTVSRFGDDVGDPICPGGVSSGTDDPPHLFAGAGREAVSVATGLRVSVERCRPSQVVPRDPRLCPRSSTSRWISRQQWRGDRRRPSGHASPCRLRVHG